MRKSLTAGEVRMVLNKGKRIAAGDVTVVYMERDNCEQRSAVIVPKKRIKSRVMRNRIQRRIRDILRESPLPYPLFVVIYTGDSGGYGTIKDSLSGVIDVVS